MVTLPELTEREHAILSNALVCYRETVREILIETHDAENVAATEQLRVGHARNSRAWERLNVEIIAVEEKIA